MIKFFTLICFITSTTVSWGLDIPSSVYRMDDLETARQVAAEKEKPLCFIESMAALEPT